MNLLLDSTVLVSVLRGRPEMIDWLTGAARSEDELMISTITVAEIYAGMRTREQDATRHLIERLEALSVTSQIAERGGNLKRMLAARGLTKGLPDMLIAGTALEHGLTLLTANVKDFPIEGLQVRELS